MAEDVEGVQEKPFNTCCAALKKKHSKLLEKYAKLEEIKNRFRDCTALVQQKYDVIEKENENLKKALEELKVQANVWKDEKEKESDIRIELEDEVSALKEEVQLLRQKGDSASQGSNQQLQECLSEAEKEIKQLTELLDKEKERAAVDKKNAELEKKKANEALKKVEMEKSKVEKEIKQLTELLDKERGRAALEKKNAELEKRKANEALKKVELEKNKASDVQKVADANQQLQERLNVAEKEIKQLRDLLDKERGRAALEKKNAELEKKKANEALKKVELEKNKASDVQKVANANQQLQERLNMAEKEIKQLTELLEKERGRAALEKKNAELEKKKANEALKKVELKKKKVSEVQKVANVERKKAEENRLSWEKLKMEIDQVKSMLALERSNSEAAKKKVEAEKHKVIAERKRADLALAKAEEQRELAETNLKKSTFEKDRADDLNRKLEEARIRAGKLAEFHEHLCTGKLVEGQAEESNTGRNAGLASDFSLAMLKNDTQLLQWMEKMPLEKEHNILREKKLADSEKKKAKKQRKVAEAYKTVAVEQKHRADQLSREVESYKLRVEELQDLQELVSYRKYADDGPLRNSNVISETDTVKLLKKQLELEKMLGKHAKKTSKVEAIRNNMLHQELCHLKQECFQLQKRLDILDENFLNGTEAINQLEKICNQTSTRETLCSDGYHRQLISGIDSRLDPPYRGSTQKMLQSSAINSSSASFSDRPLVGSQERGTFSVTKSAELGEDVSKLEPAMSKLPDKMRIRYNEHFVAKANNSTRSPIKENAKERRVGYRERKRILDAVDSIESLYSKGEKLHQRVTEKLSLLHGILNGQKDEPPAENLKEDCCKKLVRPFKRRKTLCQGTTVIHLRQDSGEPKSMLDSDVDHSDTVMHASPLESDIVKFDHHFKVGTNNTHGSKQFTPQDFDEMAAYDYMKLLDLDDAAYESSYRRAIAMPLSPTLPEVYFDGDELESDNPEMLVNRSSQERVPSIKDDLGPASSFHITDTEKSPTNLVLNGLVSSQMQTKEDSVIFLRNMDPVPASDTCFHEVHVSGRKMGIPDLSPSGNEESNTQCEKGFAHSTGDHLKYFVVSSDNKDNSSILRIFQAIGSCMPQCSFLQSAEIFLRSILHALLKAKDLSMKEKVCVFFSVTLHGISEVGTNNSADVLGDDLVQSLDSVTLHFCSALSDPALRKIFMESCHLFELLAVIEDFLLQRKVWFCGDVSAESEALHGSKINLVLNGNAMMLSQVVASPHLMVAGGNLLASVCSAVDHIGFVCEMSCNIITMQKFDPVVMLAVLHVFAHVCGSKYFNDKQYSVAMTVVKSVVMFLEKRILSTNSTSFSSSIVANPSKIWLCSTNCPFSVGALSLEDVALLLLENLQKHDRSGSLSQDSLELVKSLVPTVWSHEETTEEVSGLSEAAPFVSTYDENLCAVDILSLVDILATVVSWDWTFDHIIGPMCEYLESHLMEGFSAAAVVLLGQLGRLGVCASGYDDSGIKKLRGWLSSFVPQITFMKLSLPVQLAIINALFSLTPIKFEEIIDEKAETPAVASQSIPASSIRAWFSLLSHEQQSLFRLHQAASDSNSEIGAPSRQMF